MHIGFVPNFSCLFQSGRLFHLYMSKVWVCNIHPSGSWLQFLARLFVSSVAIACVSGAALYGKVILFSQFLSAVLWDRKCLCTPRSLPGSFFRRKKKSFVEELFSCHFWFFWRGVALGMWFPINCPASKTAETKSVCFPVIHCSVTIPKLSLLKCYFVAGNFKFLFLIPRAVGFNRILTKTSANCCQKRDVAFLLRAAST